jgi:hypothetical protein
MCFISKLLLRDAAQDLNCCILWSATLLTVSESFYGFFPKQFLGEFAKLRKTTISFVMSVHLPVRPMEQIGSHWKDFHEI